jgi:dihydrofolate reductase
MAKLIYSAITSLDGYVADDHGRFEWAEPDDEVHAFVNELERPVGTYLYGRRMYDVMSTWETVAVEGEPSVYRDFAEIWRAADKIVYSRTLTAVSTPRTRLEREFVPDAVRQLVASAEHDVSIGGPGLAARALEAGIVAELHQIVTPVIVGGGKHWLPSGVHLDLELLGERRFRNGSVYVGYRVG